MRRAEEEEKKTHLPVDVHFPMIYFAFMFSSFTIDTLPFNNNNDLLLLLYSPKKKV